ncbi:hypothetical protein AtubIFM56815_005863 [Aspergillus tubingensis]|uniref:NACHT domain-containing protein n=1 Tax=Aspergillus tubingensis TaxID=5068 RepID=A0A9W6ESB4_ASPTU|nr:hypothetical protein AtubIFM56815_005863 [Aspergillus tubingensis]
MFHDILEFHTTAVAYFRKPMWKQVFQATWSTYKAKFGPVVDSLKRHRQVFGERLTFAQLEEIRVEGIRSADALKKLRNDETMRQLRDIQCWLNSADVASDQESFRSVRSCNTHAGTWILRHKIYCAWKERIAESMLWVNGIPGAGKTILTSIMVEDCLKCYQSTIWFYFRYGDSQRSSFLSFAASIIAQLLDKNSDLIPYVFEEMCRKGKRAFSSEMIAKELLEVMMRNSGQVCIILDGLDECSKIERKKILWIRLMSGHPQNRDSSDSTICILVSQRDAITSKTLRDIPSLEITSKDTRDDIYTYIRSRGSEVQKKFQLSDESTKAMVELVMEKAGGMFLLAKLVINNLYCQVSPGDLYKELNTKEIPTQLDQAYERILNNILEEQASRIHAVQLLSWLVCAKRRLQWREIQGAVSIDLEAEDVDFEGRQWILDSRDLCDSLVEVKTDGSLELVHATAKLFLIRTNFIDVKQVELKMASLCVGYLALPGFETFLPDESVADLIGTGYYAFLDYAACFWSSHLQEGLKRTIDRKEAMMLIEVLSKFLESHYRHPAKEINIPSSAYEVKRRIEEHGPWSTSEKFLNAFASTQNQISCFTQDAATNECLDIPDVITRIRKILEKTASENTANGRADSRVLYSFYGHRLYKCPRMSCEFFHQGFETVQQRESHLSKHDRAFECSFPQCYRATIGFSSKKQLEKHIADTHEKKAREMHSFPSKRAKIALVCRFCKEEFQDTRAYRMHDCTGSSPKRPQNIEATDKSSTRGVEATTGESNSANSHWQGPGLLTVDEIENMPHLGKKEKVAHKEFVRNLWTVLNDSDRPSQEYETAHTRLTLLSQRLRDVQQAYQEPQLALQQQEQTYDTQVEQQAEWVPWNKVQHFSQLLSSIQERVLGLTFYAPPDMANELVENWVADARLRYGKALQKQEEAQTQLSEFDEEIERRQSQGDMSREEIQGYVDRRRAIARISEEGQEFVQRFTEQQETFKALWRKKVESGEIVFMPSA